MTPAALVSAIVFTPWNRRRQTLTGAVEGHPELGARSVQPPGERVRRVTIFARGAEGRRHRDLATFAVDWEGCLTEAGAVVGRRAGGAVRLSRETVAALQSRAGRAAG